MTTCLKFPLRLTTASAIVLVSIALGGLVGCGGGSRTATVAPPPLIGADETTGSKVMSWFAQVADSCYEVALGIASLAEGNPIAGGAEFAAAGLGLIGKGLESAAAPTDQQAADLSSINNALNTLLVNVQSMETQLQSLSNQISGLLNYDQTKDLGLAMKNAKVWLDTYYNNASSTGQSRAWVNCATAGWGATSPSCSSPAYPAVTAASLAAFQTAYIQYPKRTNLKLATDNFPLWWAYGVHTGMAAGPKDYTYNGSASELVDDIYQNITNPSGGVPNGLASYMKYVMSLNGGACSTDVTYPACDLYNNVYLPLENYFSLAIGRQTQLVMAQVEADTVLAQMDSAAYGSFAGIVMADFNKKLNEETEVFLQVAEQIALYRVADGRTDWSNFAATDAGPTDAGQLLARADFVVAQLVGKNYDATVTNPTAGPAGDSSYATSPWPSDGIVGRIFYADGEQIPTGTRSVCAASGQPCSGSSLPQIAENAKSLRTVTGGKPYLVWSPAVDPKSGAVTLMTGTAQTVWRVQRLVPQPATATTTATALSLSVGSDYQVASTHSPSLLAKFGFYSYDRNFVTPPGPDTRPVNPTGPDSPPDSPWVTSFGSFNAVEGAIGPYGLKFDTNTFVKGSGNMPSVVYADSYGVSSTTPGALSYSVTYVPNDYYTKYVVLDDNMSKWGGVGATPGTWSASTVVQLIIPAGTASNVKFSWPSTLDVNLSGQAAESSGKFRTEYYSYGKFEQQILQNTKPLTDISGKGTTSDVLTQCSSAAPFFSCKINLSQSVDVMVSSATATASNLTFVANFSTEVEQYDKNWDGLYKVIRTSIAPSVANWTIQTPIVTLN